MEYLIDTDWAIDYMHGHQPVVQRFDELSPLGIGLSIVSLAELYDGMFGAEERLDAEQGLQSFLDYIEEVVTARRSRLPGLCPGAPTTEGHRNSP